jgi:DUF1365 family protein
MIGSALYVGSVMHSRLRPKLHRFRYAAFWVLIDLDELKEISSRLTLFSHNKRNLFSLRDADHGDGSGTSLKEQIKTMLRSNDIDLGGGRITLLCMPRMLGHCFNPLSVYFCTCPDGGLAAIVYQVHNTFGERHAYVVRTIPGAAVERHRRPKEFYVSPFLDMDLHYEFRTSVPNARLALAIQVTQEGARILTAVMTGKRRPLDDRTLLTCALTMPWITLKVVLAIHFEALRLWLKGIRVRPHRTNTATQKTLVIAGEQQ